MSSNHSAQLQEHNFPFLPLLGQFNPNTNSAKFLTQISALVHLGRNTSPCKPTFNLALRWCLQNIHTNIPWGFRSFINICWQKAHFYYHTSGHFTWQQVKQSKSLLSQSSFSPDTRFLWFKVITTCRHKHMQK